jgi:hypothetical protein
MKYADDMALSDMIYIPSFTNLVQAFKQYKGFTSAV